MEVVEYHQTQGIINQANINQQKEPLKSKEGDFLNYEFKSGSTGLFGQDLPNNWYNLNKAINKYKLIFLAYYLFGDNGKITNNFIRKIVFKVLRLFTKQPIPGYWSGSCL